MNAAALIEAMRQEGVPDPTILAVVARLDSNKRESARAANAERQRRFRENNSRNDVTHVTPVTRDIVTKTTSREEYNTTRAPAVIPVGISNDIPPIDKNPNTTCLVKKPSRKTQLAEDAQPSDDDRSTADEHGLSASEFREEWRAFREHHCSHGNLMKNWHLAWCTWLRRRKKFQPRAGPMKRGWAASILGSSMGLENGTSGEENRDSKVVSLLPAIGEMGGRTSGYDDSRLLGDLVDVPDRRSR